MNWICPICSSANPKGERECYVCGSLRDEAEILAEERAAEEAAREAERLARLEAERIAEEERRRAEEAERLMREAERRARLEAERLARLEEERRRLAAEAAERAVAEPEDREAEIAFEDFGKVELRVAEIIACEPIPKAKKLLKLQVDLGFEKRQVVSGIAKFYTPDELIGKKVILVCNLKPAKLCGVDSYGMLLASGEDEVKVAFLDPEAKNGDRVH